MSNRIFLLFFVLICFALNATAQDQDTSAKAADSPRIQQSLQLLERWLDATLAYDKIPGASAGLVLDQNLFWSKGFGFADVKEKRPTTPETLYGICSISKLFTSIAVLQQRDAGKLHLDDPVSKFLPFANLEGINPDSPAVNIASLLTHSSGLPRESAHPYWTDPDFTFPTKEEIISGLKSQKMLYPSERYYQYSNLGLTFAGEVVEQVTGKTYEEYVQQQILKPLGLSHTTPFLPKEEKGKSLATGYGALNREGNRGVMPFYEARGIAPAAGYASNVPDLAKFASWQFRLLEKGGTNVLKASTLREMHRVHWIDPDWKTTWGLGFGIERDGDSTSVGHTGGCPGFYTAFLMIPDKKIGAIFLTNGMNIPIWRIASQMTKIVAPAIAEAQQKGAKPKTSPAGMERFTGSYWSEWGETIVVPWKDGVAALDVPSRNPMDDLTELKWISGNNFRRIRKDNAELGEEVVFETGPDGKVTRVLWHQNYSRKVN